MKTKLARAIAALAIGCTSALGCANDTGKPKVDVPDEPFGPSVGFPGVTPPLPVGGSGSVTPPSAGGPDFPGRFPQAGSAGIASCSDAKNTASGFVSDACVQCACNMKLAETIACSTECWALAACVLQHCDPTDTNCIISQCTAVVGGMANLATAGGQARAVPFVACAAQCTVDDFSEAGPQNDF
jgi:hypothetical protein